MTSQLLRASLDAFRYQHIGPWSREAHAERGKRLQPCYHDPYKPRVETFEGRRDRCRALQLLGTASVGHVRPAAIIMFDLVSTPLHLHRLHCSYRLGNLLEHTMWSQTDHRYAFKLDAETPPLGSPGRC